ncbi:hypothetical protein CWK43_08970 [Salmonella enterica subsp. enterica serovar Muenchen]|nr:hypothetical protein [Salmonella enterica subsp. enterica serovar Muenchen]EDO2870850.1 hypothetical protein [Salmonella enterica subsp. enterica serovar Muenchen]EEE6769712.1 hypothetical protein [Salmonella enterica subsp. enterica serovar Muenchen]
MESMAEGMIKDLVASGHALADDMTGAPSVLVRCLAAQLEVQLVRANALAAENAGLKAAFDKPQAYLSWHAIPPTREDPLPCGEYLDAHDDAGHKNSDGTDCWPVYSRPEIETPATDAFLAEVRAQGVEMFSEKFGGGTLISDMVKEVAKDFAAQLRKGVQS